MITIRKRNAPEIDLDIYAGCKHFEVISMPIKKDKVNLPSYSANIGDIGFVVKTLEKQNLPFVLYTSVLEFDKPTRFSFFLDKIGWVVFENSNNSIVPTEDLKIIATLFREFRENNPNDSILTCWYKCLGRLAADHVIDDNFDAVIILLDGQIRSRLTRSGAMSKCGKIWVSNKALAPFLKKSNFTKREALPAITPITKPKPNYETVAIDVVTPDGHLITNGNLKIVGDNFRRYVRICHSSMSMSVILEEFKRTYLKGMDVDIRFQWTSHDAGEFIIDDMPTDLVANHKTVVVDDKYYSSTKDLIEDYLIGECILPEHFEDFTRVEVGELMKDYPVLFAELLQCGCSLLTPKQQEDRKNVKAFLENFKDKEKDEYDHKENDDDDDDDDDDDYADSDEYYHCTKRDEHYDSTIGQVVVTVTCFSCYQEDFESMMDEWEMEGKTIYLCQDCIKGSEIVDPNTKFQKRGAGF